MLWIVGLVLLVLAGLNAPLAACVLSVAALGGFVELQPTFRWIATPWFCSIAFMVLAIQLLADLYFVPITVKDRIYLNPQRTQNNYLHARVQSFFRPLVGAILAAALPLPVPDWLAAVCGFAIASGCYWFSAWIREHVAISRGAIVLLVLETLKNALLIGLALLVFWRPPLALGLLVVLLAPVIIWTLQLQQEQSIVTFNGGQRVGEDPRVVRSE